MFLLDCVSIFNIFRPLGIKLERLNLENPEITRDVAGVIVQYPNTEGLIYDLEALISEVHNQGVDFLDNLIFHDRI